MRIEHRRSFTVRELIEKLLTLEQDAPIYTYDSDGDIEPIGEIMANPDSSWQHWKGGYVINGDYLGRYVDVVSGEASESPSVYSVRICTFNTEFTCREIMDAGNGHCCREYDQYEAEVNRVLSSGKANESPNAEITRGTSGDAGVGTDYRRNR